MAALTLFCGPLISRQTMPISSVTLAWRTLVTTGNLWPNSQITGFVINLTGYISHSRFWTDSVAGLDFLVGMGILFSTARDGGDDGNFVAVAQSRVLVLQKANVLLVDIDVDEPPHAA